MKRILFVLAVLCLPVIADAQCRLILNPLTGRLECGGTGEQGPEGPSVADGDKGDIVVSGSGAAWAIDTGVIVDADVNAAAAIALSKLAALTASRALASDGSGVVAVTSVTATELGYLSGVTSALQTQLGAKQASDSDLTALAGLSATGLVARTGAGTASARTITGTANEVAVTNGDGVSGNPTLSLPTGINAAKIGDGSVSTAEFQYLANVTSDIQGQIDGLVGAGVSDGDKGDIVVSVSGTVWAIDTGVIVNADVNASAAIALSKLAAVTAGRALVSDGSGFVSAATTTATEIGYVNGVTSSIQTQLGTKITSIADPNADRIFFWDDSAGAYAFLTIGSGLDLTDTTLTATASGVSDGDKGDITVSGTGATWNIDAGAVGDTEVASGIDAVKIGAGGVTNTEYGYLANVTSDIQGQIDGLSAGGATAISGLSNCKVTVSGDTLTISTPCVLVFGSVSTTVASTATCVLSGTSSSDSMYVYAHPDSGLTCDEDTSATNTPTNAAAGTTGSFPTGVIPIAVGAFTANSFTGVTDLRSFANGSVPVSGTGVTVTEIANGTKQIAVDSSVAIIPTLQSGAYGYCRSTTGNDTYTCTLSQTLTTYTRGMEIRLDADTANTGTATLAVDGLAAVSILTQAGAALSDGDIGANLPKFLLFDGTNFLIQGDGGGGGGIANVVEDTTPQLGGNLDAQTFTITGVGGLQVAGTPSASATAALATIGESSFSSGHASGQYLGIRAPSGNSASLLTVIGNTTVFAEILSSGAFRIAPSAAGASNATFTAGGSSTVAFWSNQAVNTAANRVSIAPSGIGNSSGTMNLFNIDLPDSTSSTGGYNGILINKTGSGTGSGAKKLINLQVGGASMFDVDVSGLATASGNFAIGNGATSAGVLTIKEDTDNGSNFASFSVPALAANTVYVLPPDDGDAGEQLTTDGSGNLTWEAAGSGAPAFSSITGATNTTAAMVVGTGASLDVTGSGTINATSLGGTAAASYATDAEVAAGYQPLDSDLTALAGGVALTAASAPNLDNSIPRMDGTGRAVQASGCTIDDSDVLTCAGGFSAGGGSVAGMVGLTAGTTNTPGTSEIVIEAPTSVTAYKVIMPTTVGATGVAKVSVSGAVATMSFAALADSDIPDTITASNYQPLDADLTALAGNGTNGMLARTGAGAVSSRTITGTSNEVSVANGDGASGNPTLSLPATIDLGGKTSFELPNGASPTVDAFGEIAGDNDLWAASRGAPVFFDGTAAVALIGVLVSDAPSNGQVPKWNTGGTITWENDNGGGTGCVPSGSNNQILTDDGAGACASEAAAQFNAGVLFLGTAGSVVGAVDFSNATSGSITIQPPTGALGVITQTLQAVSGNIPSIQGSLAVASGKTLTASNTLTFTGTDSSSVAFGAGGTVLYSGGALGTPSSGTATNLTGLPTTGLVNNAVTSAKMAVVNTRRVCDMVFGDTTGSALTDAQLGPQKRLCFIPAAATVVEVTVAADAGTPNIIVARNVAGTVANLTSAALATAASGGIACSKTTAVTGIDGATTCSATLQNTVLAAGSYIEAVSGTAGGTAKLMTVHVVYTVD